MHMGPCRHVGWQLAWTLQIYLSAVAHTYWPLQTSRSVVAFGKTQTRNSNSTRLSRIHRFEWHSRCSAAELRHSGRCGWCSGARGREVDRRPGDDHHPAGRLTPATGRFTITTTTTTDHTVNEEDIRRKRARPPETTTTTNPFTVRHLQCVRSVHAMASSMTLMVVVDSNSVFHIPAYCQSSAISVFTARNEVAAR